MKRNFFVAVVAVAVLGACATPPQLTTGPAASGNAAPVSPDLSGMTHTRSGLRLRDLVTGDGEHPRPGSTVRIHYLAALRDGSVVQSVMPPQTPFEFRLRSGVVIPGLDEGVSGMRVGGKRQLVLAPQLAYGSRGAGPIPPNATLIFVVELISVE